MGWRILSSVNMLVYACNAWFRVTFIGDAGCLFCVGCTRDVDARCNDLVLCRLCACSQTRHRLFVVLDGEPCSQYARAPQHSIIAATWTNVLRMLLHIFGFGVRMWSAIAHAGNCSVIQAETILPIWSAVGRLSVGPARPGTLLCIFLARHVLLSCHAARPTPTRTL